MKEFKFRAWDYKKKDMLKVVSINEIYVTVSPEDNDDEGNYDYDLQYKLFEDGSGEIEADVMQYIERIDKNKKEIFFGDILRVIYSNIIEEEFTSVVKWSDVVLGISPTALTQMYYEVEVIGNIYKDKELLDERV